LLQKEPGQLGFIAQEAGLDVSFFDMNGLPLSFAHVETLSTAGERPPQAGRCPGRMPEEFRQLVRFLGSQRDIGLNL
jgi:hypothetical protein